MDFLRHQTRSALILAAATAAVAGEVRAQAVLGPGDDAWHVPGGVMRIGVSTRFFSADDRFFSGQRTALGAQYSGVLGVGQLSSLQWLEGAVTELSGAQSFRVSLGTARTDLRRASALIPLELALGVTSRVMLHAAVPFHTGEQEINWLLDPTGATVGANPALLGAGPLSLNASLIGGLDTAAAQLERLADACIADPASDDRCAMIAGELAAVRQLIDESRGVTNSLANTYGGRDGVAPAAFVPLNDTPAHDGTVARIDDLRTRYERYGTTSVGEGAAPVGAGVGPTVAALRALLADSAYAYHPDAFSRRYAQGFGDLDVGVSILLFDGIRDTTSWTRLGAASLGVRQAIGFTYRLGTGTPAAVDDPLRIATGDGQDDLEFVSATDLLFNRRFWTSVIARYTIQQPRDGLARIPDGTGSPFIARERRRETHYEPGDRVDISVLPRWVLNEYAAVGLSWRWLRQAGERYTEIAPFTDGIPLSYAGPDMSAHEVGVGFTWSSVAAWQRDNARWPIEVQYDRRLVIAGDGGTPRFSSDRIAVRVYARLWGR